MRRGADLAVTRARSRTTHRGQREALDEGFAVRSATDAARELGQMKGAVMKLGQMIGFVADGLPPAAQEAFAQLQQDVPPMAPSLAEQVILEELGDRPEALFLEWDPVPVAAASIGQVHRAVMPDGRRVAVKVQYPGVDRAIRNDLDHAERLYAMFSAFTLSGIDVHALVDELRDRMGDELDYRHEADAQEAFAERYRGHPFVRIAGVVRERSARRVLTSEWVGGATFAELLDRGSAAEHQHVAEVLFRFAQGSLHEYRTFNGDPHPGNYRFHRDGTVTFLDFGLVKHFTDSEYGSLIPTIDHVLAGDGPGLVGAMERAGFLHPGHGLDADRVFRTVSAPYRAFLPEVFTFTPDYTREVAGYLDQALKRMMERIMVVRFSAGSVEPTSWTAPRRAGSTPNRSGSSRPPPPSRLPRVQRGRRSPHRLWLRGSLPAARSVHRPDRRRRACGLRHR